MTVILSFVALRKPPENTAPPTLAAVSDFQQQLAAAAGGPDPSGRAVAVAQAFVDEQRFVGSPDGLSRGAELLALHAQLSDGSSRRMAQIDALVRAAVGGAV